MVNLLIKLEITDDHIRRGDLKSAFNDPIALALREHLQIPFDHEHYTAIGDDEIFFCRRESDGRVHSYIADFDAKGYWSSPNRPRVITISAREV